MHQRDGHAKCVTSRVPSRDVRHQKVKPHPFPMPPKEKAVNSGITAESQQSAPSDGIYNYELPRSLVAKIARASVRGSDPRYIAGDKHTQVPDNSKFQKETILALLKGSTVFINCLGMYTFVQPSETV